MRFRDVSVTLRLRNAPLTHGAESDHPVTQGNPANPQNDGLGNRNRPLTEDGWQRNRPLTQGGRETRLQPGALVSSEEIQMDEPLRRQGIYMHNHARTSRCSAQSFVP